MTAVYIKSNGKVTFTADLEPQTYQTPARREVCEVLAVVHEPRTQAGTDAVRANGTTTFRPRFGALAGTTRRTGFRRKKV